MKPFTLLLGGCLLLALASRGLAHFRLLEPASWLVESEDFGDPQWSAPCGGTLTNPGKPTGAITESPEAVTSCTSESGRWLSTLAFTALLLL